MSCDISSDPSKLFETIYFNYSTDKITKIRLEIVDSDKKIVKEAIEIETVIQPGDSLKFDFNSENFISTSNYSYINTTIFFQNLPPIFNKMAKEEWVSGFISNYNTFVLLLYIGDSKMVICGRKKSDFSDVNLDAWDCKLELLK
ncbi:MAG: hypothetical protein U0V04_13620 [Spirosomataceae bacterium]|jgi:hypothetical protein